MGRCPAGVPSCCCGGSARWRSAWRWSTAARRCWAAAWAPGWRWCRRRRRGRCTSGACTPTSAWCRWGLAIGPACMTVANAVYPCAMMGPRSSGATVFPASYLSSPRQTLSLATYHTCLVPCLGMPRHPVAGDTRPVLSAQTGTHAASAVVPSRRSPSAGSAWWRCAGVSAPWWTAPYGCTATACWPPRCALC